MAALSVADSSDSEPVRALSAPLPNEIQKEKHCCRSCKSVVPPIGEYLFDLCHI